MKRLKNKLASHRAGKVLEVGTGTGGFIPTLLDIFNQVDQMIGIDMDPNSILQAQNTYNDNTKLEFIVMNAEQINYADHTFDTVCISNALHHTPEESKVLDEMKRVLKRNGLFSINEMFCDYQNEAQITHVMYHHFSSEIDRRLGMYHRQTYTRQEILDLIDHRGIRIESIYEHYEPKKNVRAEQDMYLVSQACLKHIERTNDFVDHAEFKRRGEEIIERLHHVGIQRPTQLMILGRV